MVCHSLAKGRKVLHRRAEGPEVGLLQVAVLEKSPTLMDKDTESQRLQVQGQEEKLEGQAG